MLVLDISPLLLSDLKTFNPFSALISVCAVNTCLLLSSVLFSAPVDVTLDANSDWDSISPSLLNHSRLLYDYSACRYDVEPGRITLWSNEIKLISVEWQWGTERDEITGTIEDRHDDRHTDMEKETEGRRAWGWKSYPANKRTDSVNVDHERGTKTRLELQSRLQTESEILCERRDKETRTLSGRYTRTLSKAETESCFSDLNNDLHVPAQTVNRLSSIYLTCHIITRIWQHCVISHHNT